MSAFCPEGQGDCPAGPCVVGHPCGLHPAAGSDNATGIRGALARLVQLDETGRREYRRAPGPETGREATKEAIVVSVEAPTPVQAVGPCPGRGPHRWAWLNDGGQACGYCGRPRR